MNYDPIHDTYVTTPARSSPTDNASPPTQQSQAHSPNSLITTHVNGSSQVNASQSPPRKAFSINSLVSPSTNARSRNILNPDEDNNDHIDLHIQNAEHDDEDDEDENIDNEDHEDDMDLDYDENKSKNKSTLNKHKQKTKTKKLKAIKQKPKKIDASSPQSKPIANPSNHSINKASRHLKKLDGEPFWRKDIQYDFLTELFDDDHKVFTNTFPHSNIPDTNNGPKLTFAELYVRTLAESSKSSKILKERLIKDKDMGIAVGKVCILVNAGRMNTTINFVPEMRSSLRTYHSIPSLQADPLYGGSKPLQDTPRLKSILKAVCEGQEHLKTVGDIINNPTTVKPNTNVIQLIFLLSNHYHNIRFHYEENVEQSQEVDQDHDNQNINDENDDDSKRNTNKFMEFFLNDKIHPKNRAQRFLWLIYTYLETSFTPEELANNPFNPNVIPPIELIPEADYDKFDVDTDYEIKYSEKMYNARLKYVADEEHNSNPKRGNRSKKDREDLRQQLLQYRKKSGDNLSDEDLDSSDTSNLDLLDSTYGKSLSSKKRIAAQEKLSKKRKTTNAKDNTMIDDESTTFGNTSTFSLADGKKTIKSSKLKKSSTTSTKQGNGSSNNTAKKLNTNSTPGDLTKSTNEEISSVNNINPVNHLSSPIEDIDKLFQKYVASTPIIPLSNNNKLSMSSRLNIISKSKNLVRQTKNANKSTTSLFNSKLSFLNYWLFKYFQYKKSNFNGLLSMEWEDIRYDLINGVETFLYQQFGKEFNNNRIKQIQDQKQSDSNLEENQENGDFVQASTEAFNASASNTLSSIHGSVGTVDYNSIESCGTGYIPMHDFNKGNERNLFTINLLSFCNDWFLNNVTVADITQNNEIIKFDLTNERIQFS